jgi:hypothetical protein
MSKVNVRPSVEVQKSGEENNKPTWPRFLDAIVIVSMGVILYLGALSHCFTPLFCCEAQLSWELYSPCFTRQSGKQGLLLQ